jgi:hypothetical protein
VALQNSLVVFLRRFCIAKSTTSSYYAATPDKMVFEVCFMNDKDSKSLDILGIKPIGDSINTIVKGTMDGAAAFLSRICLPAAEEFGLLLRDKVSNWRAQNIVRMTEKAERKLGVNPGFERKHVHPRLLSLTLENSSWVDADEVQEMWAGLLASSCTEDGRDESNLIFINLLSQLTTAQARILNHSCSKAQKRITEAGWIAADHLSITLEVLQQVSDVQDFHRLDRELDHLRALELIESGFSPHSTTADITPTALALHLFVRCQGTLLSPVEYFELSQPGTSTDKSA